MSEQITGKLSEVALKEVEQFYSRGKYPGTIDRLYDHIDALAAENAELRAERDESGERELNSIAELGEQLAVANKRLAELAKGADWNQEEFAQFIHEEYSRHSGLAKTVWSALLKRDQDKYMAVAPGVYSFVAARVRAPLLHQIADLKAGLETLGPKVICERSHYEGIVAERDRLATELAAEKKNHQATAELLEAMSRDASCDAELSASAKVEGSLEQFLAANPPEPTFMPYVYKPGSGGLRAHWKADENWLDATYEQHGIRLFRSRETNEIVGCKLAASQARQFACPKCGSRGYGDCQDGAVYCIRGDGIGCGWSGHWSEVESAKAIPSTAELLGAVSRDASCDAELASAAKAESGVEQFLADNPSAKEFTPYVYKPGSRGLRAHWKPDCDWLDSTYERYGILLFHSLKTNEVIGCELAAPDHSVDAAEKVEVRKGNGNGARMIHVTAQSQDGSIYLVRAQNGDQGWIYDSTAHATREFAKRSAGFKSVPSEIDEFVPALQLSAERQAREAAEQNLKATAELLSVVSKEGNELRQRAEQAEAAAAIREACERRYRSVSEILGRGKGTWGQPDYIKDDSWNRYLGEQYCLRTLFDIELPDAARTAANELRVLRAFVDRCRKAAASPLATGGFRTCCDLLSEALNEHDKGLAGQRDAGKDIER